MFLITNVLHDQACHGKLTINNNYYYCQFKTKMMINNINSYPLTLTEPSHYITKLIILKVNVIIQKSNLKNTRLGVIIIITIV